MKIGQIPKREWPYEPDVDTDDHDGCKETRKQSQDPCRKAGKKEHVPRTDGGATATSSACSFLLHQRQCSSMQHSGVAPRGYKQLRLAPSYEGVRYVESRINTTGSASR